MKKVLWIVNGLLCASFLAFVVAPKSEHPGVLCLIAALVLLGGLAKATGFWPPLEDARSHILESGVLK